jgi:hypothetical protein
MRSICTPSRALAASLLVAAPASFADVGLRSDDFDVPGASSGAPSGLWDIDTELRPARGWTGAFVSQRLATNAARLQIAPTVELHANANTGPNGAALPQTAAAFQATTGSLHRLHGFTDISFGAKWRVRGGDAGWLPGVAWLADVETTTGTPAFRGPVFRPSLRATAEWSLQPGLTLGVMPGIYRDRDDSGKHYAAAVLAFAIGKEWTPRLHSFVELAGERLPLSQRGGSSVTLDTGVAFRATRALQFEAIISRGVDGASPNAQAGVGLSSRF